MASAYQFRMTAEGVQQLEQQLRALGPAGEEALQKLKTAAPQLADALDKARQRVDEAKGAIDKLSSGSSSADAALGVLSGKVKGELSSAFEGLVAKTGTVGEALSKFGIIGAGVAAGLGLLVAKFEGLKQIADIEQSQAKLGAVLQSTGFSSGVTAKSVNDLAASLAKVSFVTKGEVREAATVLATFSNVGSDAFARVIKVADDMTAVLGGDLTDKVRALGKVMDDPVQGMGRLARIGVVLTAQQKEVIKGLAETGDQAGALSELLDILNSKFGGAGEAAHSGLNGALDAAAKAQKAFNVAIADSPALMAFATTAVNAYAAAWQGAAAAVRGVSPEQQLAAVKSQIAQLQANGGQSPSTVLGGSSGMSMSRFLDVATRDDDDPADKLSSLRRQAAALEAQISSRAETGGWMELRAQEGERAANAARFLEAQDKQGGATSALSAELGTKLRLAGMDPLGAQVSQARDAAYNAVWSKNPNLAAGGGVDAIQAEALAQADLAEKIVRTTEARKLEAEAAKEQEKQDKLDFDRMVERLAKQDEATNAINALIDATREEIYQGTLNDKERAERIALLKAEAEARKGGIALTDAQREALKRETDTLFDQKKAQAEQQKAAEEFERVARRTTDKIVGFGAQAIDAFLDKGKVSDFFATMAKEAKRTFSEIAANALLRPIIQPLVVSALGSLGAIFTSGGAAFAASGAGGGGGFGSFLGGGGGGGSSGGFGFSSLSSVGSLLNSGSGALGGPTIGSLFGDSAGFTVTGLGNSVNSALGFSSVGIGTGGGVGSAGAAGIGGPAILGSVPEGTAVVAGGEGLGTGAAGIGVAGGALAGIGGGFAAGTLINTLAGGNQTNGTIGSAGGAVIGAGIGTLIAPGIGTLIGGLIGGAAGGGFGGMFGPGISSQSAGFSFDTATRTGGFTSKGSANVSAAGGLQGSIGAIISELEGMTGGTIAPLSLAGDVSTKGTRIFNFDRTNGSILNQFSTIADAADFLSTQLTGLSGDMKTVADHAHGFIDLQLGVSFLKLYDAAQVLVPQTTQQAEAYKALGKQFDDMAAQTTRWGLSVEKLQAGMAANFNQTIADAIQQMTDPLGFALGQAKITADARRALAVKEGADLVQIDRLSALEREQISNGILGNLKGLADSLTIGDLSPLTPAQRIAALGDRFASAAAAGSPDLASIGSALVSGTRDFYGTTAAYGAVRDDVLATVNGFIGPQQSSSSNDNLTRAGILTNEEGFARMVAALADLKTVIKDQMAAQNRANITPQRLAV